MPKISPSVSGIRLMLGLAAVLFAATSAVSLAVAEGPTRLTSALLQDESRNIPKDSIALFLSSDPEIELVMDYVAITEADSAATTVALVRPDGRLEDVEADADGRFRIKDVTEGLFAVVATVGDSIASIPVYAQQADADANELEPMLDEQDVAVRVPVIPGGLEAASTLAEQYVSYTEQDTVDPIRFDLTPEPRHGYQVRKTGDGMLGQIILATRDGADRSLLANNNLFLIRNGVRVASAISDADGSFSFDDVSPGFHGIVAAGPAGYTAFNFEILATNAFAGNEAASLADAGYVSKVKAEATSVLPCLMIPPELVGGTVELIRRSQPIVGDVPIAADGMASPGIGGGAPFGAAPAGGFGGGGFGGGGGGFGGGGFGGLAALAGIGGVIAAVASDNDDATPPVISLPPPAASPASLP